MQSNRNSCSEFKARQSYIIHHNECMQFIEWTPFFYCRYCARFTIVSTSLYCNTTEFSKKWANELQLRKTVCVQCDPFAMDKDLGTRCKGHGVYKEVTRWNAVDVPYCTGLWRQETEPTDCVCDVDLKDSFILIWAGGQTNYYKNSVYDCISV